jgi:glycine/D-amino acid oxidase-like deaminating enzyme
MFSLSYWERKSFFNDIDLVIIGSGIVGLNAAMHFRKLSSKAKILVIERGALPSGASSKNAGFACFGSPSELLDDLQTMSEEKVFNLVARRYNGLEKLRKIHGDKAIGYKAWGGFELFDDEEIFQRCAEKLKFLNTSVSSITDSLETYKVSDKKLRKFGFGKMTHMLENKFEGQIDTGKLIISLLKKAQKNDIRIINGLSVESFEDHGSQVSVQLPDGMSFTTKKLIVCTNGFAKKLMPSLEVNPARAQVLITEPIDDLPFKGTFHFDRGYYYFRNIDGRILFGGGRNLDVKGETTTYFGLTDQIQGSLETMLREVIIPGKEFKIAQRWSGIMGVGPEKTTIISSISANIFCGVRMGGMGVAIGTLVGEDVADLCYQS